MNFSRPAGRTLHRSSLLTASHHREALPSISHLDLAKINVDKVDHQRLHSMPGLSISTVVPCSPITNSQYSGPPPPYSYASSLVGHAPTIPAYISPPETARPTVRDEKDFPHSQQSLPSIQEALGGQDKIMAFATPVTSAHNAPSFHQSLPTPSSAGRSSFPEPPSGPSNPFSQPPPINLLAREPVAPREVEAPTAAFAMINSTEPRSQTSQGFGMARSPGFSTSFIPPGYSSIHRPQPPHHGSTPAPSPRNLGHHRSSFAFSTQMSNPPASKFPSTGDAARYNPTSRFDEAQAFHPHSGVGTSYGESVKRHLDVFDTELALNEVLSAMPPFTRDVVLTCWLDLRMLHPGSRICSRLVAACSSCNTTWMRLRAVTRLARSR